MTKPNRKKRKSPAFRLLNQDTRLVPIDSIQPHEQNVNQADLGAIIESERVNGFYGTIVVQQSTGKILAGKHRWLSAKELGAAEIPVTFIDCDDAAALRIMLADNRTNRLGFDDPAALASLLQSLPSFDGTGFDKDALDNILADLGAGGLQAGLTDPDAVPETPVVPVTQPGDLWLLGNHRLLCADSTQVDAVERLMGGEKAGLINTDPPYGVSYANAERPNPGVAKPRVAKPRVANDELSGTVLQALLTDVFQNAKVCALVDGAAWYVWFANIVQHWVFAAAAAAVQLKLHREIIWVKPVLLLGRGQYHWKHEPCFMGWVQGHEPPDYGLGDGERTQTTVWEVGSVTQAERKEFNHATPKPVELFRIPIRKHLRAGEICYEPFAGSGPQFIAAEELGVRCFGLELAPQYCDVICKRWMEFTGKQVTLDGHGATFEHVAHGRQMEREDHDKDDVLRLLEARA